ncbi:hypothetical protein [Streptomyces beihaiensis]|uniref:Integral membrane protein n=1 Tax=Streptomyces beihaiensis TaxID=2984495 RepID=A0ABT3U032_9ACTN|nr:hypothetical protein [Streptomyces beihaiensis]MCX3062672.1 hypothetical protein [Streptomyces beihaiensis]
MVTKTDVEPEAANAEDAEQSKDAGEAAAASGERTEQEEQGAQEQHGEHGEHEQHGEHGERETEPVGPTGVGQGAGAIVSVALGVVALSGGWLGTIASARESLIGQLDTSQSASVAKQVSEVYGDSWHAAALVGGIFSLIALVIGAAVLARPAFGVPGRPQALWIKSTAWAGVTIGVLGLLLAVAKYTDLLLGLPKTG